MRRTFVLLNALLDCRYAPLVCDTGLAGGEFSFVDEIAVDEIVHKRMFSLPPVPEYNTGLVDGDFLRTKLTILSIVLDEIVAEHIVDERTRLDCHRNRMIGSFTPKNTPKLPPEPCQ